MKARLICYRTHNDTLISITDLARNAIDRKVGHSMVASEKAIRGIIKDYEKGRLDKTYSVMPYEGEMGKELIITLEWEL